jgi:hypothetical protein
VDVRARPLATRESRGRQARGHTDVREAVRMWDDSTPPSWMTADARMSDARDDLADYLDTCADTNWARMKAAWKRLNTTAVA